MQANTKDTISVAPLLLNADGTALALGISVRQVRKLNASGMIPAPIKIQGSVRWRADELGAWVAAGAPSRVDWEVLKKNSARHCA